MKGLLAVNEISKKLNFNSSVAFLHTGSLNFGEDTFFFFFFELQPSHYFIYDLSKNKLDIKRYYELLFYDTYEKFNEKKCREYIEGTKERVINAVDLRLNADVTVGSCLSGGIDSSSIVCSINNLLKSKSYNSIGPKQGVVTACYNNSIIDESNWAKYIVDHVSADWHKTFPQKEDLEQDLSDLIYSQDVPFGSTSIYAQYSVLKTAKEAGLKVMLDGQGGDELFTGYTPYYNMFYAEAKNNNDDELLQNEQLCIHNTPLSIKGNIPVKQKSKNNNILLSSIKKIIPKRIKGEIKKIIKIPNPIGWHNYININEKKTYKYYTYETLNQMLHTLMSYSSLPLLLKYEDRNSMRFSIESRTPFADDINLIEYIFSIPSVYKIHNGGVNIYCANPCLASFPM
jgi:asparagine synthase (glutamine-hydrolysing)